MQPRRGQPRTRQQPSTISAMPQTTMQRGAVGKQGWLEAELLPVEPRAKRPAWQTAGLTPWGRQPLPTALPGLRGHARGRPRGHRVLLGYQPAS